MEQMEQEQTEAAPTPLATPTVESVEPTFSVADLDLLAAKTPAERIEQLESLMSTDIQTYWDSGANEELLALRRDLAPEDPPTDAEPGEDDAEEADADAEVEDTADAETADDDTYRHVDAVPETADDYQLPEIDGYSWDENAKEGLAPFLEAFHEAEIPQTTANKLLEVYGERMAAIDARDEADVESAREALVAEFGSPENYKAAITQVKTFVVDLGDLGFKIAEARTPDGTRLVNDPTYIKLLHELSDSSGAQPPGSRSAPTGLDAEFNELNALLQSDVGAFQNAPWKGTSVTGSERMLQLRRVLKR